MYVAEMVREAATLWDREREPVAERVRLVETVKERDTEADRVDEGVRLDVVDALLDAEAEIVGVGDRVSEMLEEMESV